MALLPVFTKPRKDIIKRYFRIWNVVMEKVRLWMQTIESANEAARDWITPGTFRR